MKAGQVLAIVLLVLGLGAGVFFALPSRTQGDVDPSLLPAPETGPGGGGLDATGRLPEPGAVEKPGTARREVAEPLRGSGTGRVSARLLQRDLPLAGARAWVVLAGRKRGTGDAEATSDSRGRIEIGRLPAGRYRLALEHADVAWDWSGAEFSLAGGEQKNLGDVVVPPASGLRGRVTDPAGAPLGKVTVFLRAGLLSSLMARAPDSHLTARTGALGRFELTRLRAAAWIVTCDHPDYRLLEKKVDLEAGSYVDLGELALARGRELTGRVVDTAGRGIQAARITPEQVSRIGGDTATFYCEQRSVETDAQGEFRLRGLPDRVKLRVLADGFEPVMDHEVAADAVTIRIVLERRFGVSGRVTNAGEHEVHVWLIGASRGASVLAGRQRLEQRAKPDGRFFFDRVMPGVYTILAEAATFGASKPRKIRVVAEGLAGLVLTLEEGPEVEVAVTGPKGEPIAGARVRLRIEAEGAAIGRLADPGRTPQRLGRTGRDGSATLTGAWTGRGVLDVSHPLYLPAVRDHLLLRAGRNRVRIRLEPGGWIEGRCTDTAGRPLAGIEVRVGAKPDGRDRIRVGYGSPGGALLGDSKVVQSGKDGDFRAGPLRAGPYLVRALREAGGTTITAGGAKIRFDAGGGEADATAETEVVAGRTSSVVLRLAQPGALSGVVRYGGQTIAGARVFAKKVGDHDAFAGVFGGKSARTDETGRYRFERVAAGRWNLSVKPPRGAVATRPVEVVVPEGGPATRDLELGGGQIRGRLQRPGSESRGYAGIDVLLSDPAQPTGTRRVAFRIATTRNGAGTTGGMSMHPPGAPDPVPVGRDGSFEIRFVPAGKWTVRVREGEDLTLWVKTVEVAANQLLDLGRMLLRPVFPVKLRILGEDGAPIPFGTVRVAVLDEDGKPGEGVFSGIARAGVCRIPGLAPGRYRVTCRQVVAGGGAEPPEQSGELEVGPAGAVTGTELRIGR